MSGFLHTQGPWASINQDLSKEALSKYIAEGVMPAGDDGIRGTDIRAVGEYRGSVATLYSAEHIDGITIAERDANAARIVACVNACDAAGLTNETLDGGAMGELVEALRVASALSKAGPTTEIDTGFDGPYHDHIDGLLAKIGGTQ